MNALDSDAAQMLDFWFGVNEARGERRKQWFTKDATFDEAIRTRFMALYERGASGQLAHWQQSAADCLALIILLDQFPRNMFRGSARAFATDALALATANHALAVGFDRSMLPVERQFIYLPLEHSESLGDQKRCVQLMTALSGFPQTGDVHEWAEKHRVIIQRFGRFPHRNAILGRTSTAAEVEFLQQPGSGF